MLSIPQNDLFTISEFKKNDLTKNLKIPEDTCDR